MLPMTKDGVSSTTAIPLMTGDGVSPTLAMSPVTEDGVSPTPAMSLVTADGVLPTLAMPPVTEDGVSPTLAMSPVTADGVSPTLAMPPVTEDGVSPTLAMPPVTEDGVSPTLAMSPVTEDGVSPTLAMSPVTEDGVSPTLAMSPVTADGVSPTLAMSPVTEDGVSPTPAMSLVTEDGGSLTLGMSSVTEERRSITLPSPAIEVPTRATATIDYEVPDGGWGWIVVFSSLMINLLVDGVGLAYGVILPKLVEYFSETKSKVSLVGSVLIGTYLCTGPLWGGLVKVYGCRVVTIVGSVLSCVAFLCGSFSPSIDVLIVLYGFVGGLGIGMMYFPSIVSVSQYFDKKRSIATGIALCGSGIGTFVFSPMIEFLSTEFSWRGILMIVSGITLNGVVFGSLMRPIRRKKVEGLQSIHTITGQNTPERIEKIDTQTNVRKDTALPSHDSHCILIKFGRDNLCLTETKAVEDNVDKTKACNKSTAKHKALAFVCESVIGLINVSLLLDPKFTLLFIGDFLVAVGIFIPIMYIVDRALLLGIQSTNAAFLLSVIGIANVIGRIAAGLIAHSKSVDALVMAICVLLVAAVSLFLQQFYTSYTLLVLFCVVYGLCIGVFVITSSILVCSLLGIDKFTAAWGLYGLGRGIGSVIGPYLAGELFELTGKYAASFYLCGSTFFLAAVFHVLASIYCFLKRKENLKDKNLQMDVCINILN